MKNKNIDLVPYLITVMIVLIVGMAFLLFAKGIIILAEVSSAKPTESIYICECEDRDQKKNRHISSKTVFKLPELPDISESIEFPNPTTKIQEEPLTFEDQVKIWGLDICPSYPNVNPYLILSIIYQESRFIPNVSSGKSVGLMQVSSYWQADRTKKLNVEDICDPYSNILVGTDLLNELLEMAKGNVSYALMMYNQGVASAKNSYSRGVVSGYAKEVIQREKEYEEVDLNGTWSTTG